MSGAQVPLRVAIYARTAEADFAPVDAAIARLGHLIARRMPPARRLEVHPYPEVCEAGLGVGGPMLRRLLHDARAGRLDAVLVEDLAALTLVPIRQSELVAALNEAGVHVLTCEVVRAWPAWRRPTGSGTQRGREPVSGGEAAP